MLKAPKTVQIPKSFQMRILKYSELGMDLVLSVCYLTQIDLFTKKPTTIIKHKAHK